MLQQRLQKATLGTILGQRIDSIDGFLSSQDSIEARIDIPGCLGYSVVTLTGEGQDPRSVKFVNAPEGDVHFYQAHDGTLNRISPGVLRHIPRYLDGVKDGESYRRAAGEAMSSVVGMDYGPCSYVIFSRNPATARSGDAIYMQGVSCDDEPLSRLVLMPGGEVYRMQGDRYSPNPISKATGLFEAAAFLITPNSTLRRLADQPWHAGFMLPTARHAYEGALQAYALSPVKH